MAEVLELSVKSNIKSVTKDTQDYAKSLERANTDLKEQKDILMMLQKEQIKLEQAQAKMSDWEKHISGSAKKLSNLKLEIKDQRLAVRDLTMQQKDAKDAVKEMTDAQKEQNDTLLSGIANYKVFGVSLNGIKTAFSKIIPTAKVMFSTIKAGIISTGVGALVVAFGSLMAWFTKTKAGAEVLSKIFSGLGAAVGVIVDRIANFGGAISKMLSGDISGGLNAMKNTFTGIGDEIARETTLAIALKQSLIELADAERALNVETAQRRAEIEDLRLKADDLTLSEQERIQAVEEAGRIERDLMDKRVANAEEAVRIQQAQMAMSNNMKEDLDELAQKEITLANIRRESATKQRAIQTKLNRIQKQAEANQIAAHKRWVSRQNEKIKKQNAVVTKWNDIWKEQLLGSLATERQKETTQAKWRADQREKEIKESVFDAEKRDKLLAQNFTLFEKEKADIKKKFDDAEEEFKAQVDQKILDTQNETLLAQIENDRERAAEELRLAEEADLKSVERLYNKEEQEAAIRDKYAALRKKKSKKEAEEDEATAKAVADSKRDMALNGLKVIEGIAGEGSKLAKAAAIAQVTISGIQSVQEAFKSGVANTAMMTATGGTYGIIQGGLAAAFSAMQLQKIMSAPTSGGGGGGGGAGGGGGTGGAGAETPAPQMMSGAFELSGGVAPEAMKAFVVTDEMTNSQNQLANIRRRATI